MVCSSPTLIPQLSTYFDSYSYSQFSYTWLYGLFIFAFETISSVFITCANENVLLSFSDKVVYQGVENLAKTAVCI